MRIQNHHLNKLNALHKKLTNYKLPAKFIFIVMGIASTLWFLIRVIPKPQRAGYPCMKTAAPIMSGFVLYLLSLGGLTLAFKKAVDRFKKAKYLSAAFAMIIGVALLIVFNWNDSQPAYSNTISFTREALPDGANNPMGEGIGVNPGRVVWVWDEDATNENCTNKIDDAFFMEENNDQTVVNTMMDDAIKQLASKESTADAWDALFKNFNERKLGKASGYETGQTVFIKVNNGQAGWAINRMDLSETGTTSRMTGQRNIAMSGTTPATVVALIKQLVDDCKIPQEKIYVGEPMTHVYKSMYDAIHSRYPNVIILDRDGYSNLGRTQSAGWSNRIIHYSDNGSEMPDASGCSTIMKEMESADYLINAAALKAHARNGISVCAKLHFGSHGNSRNSAASLHPGLICSQNEDQDAIDRGEYGMYRVLVDLMGHEKLGGNTVLFMVDALWAGIEATDMPVKWGMEPFNNDFPNSIFLSQDGVAVESVSLDFLRAEAENNKNFNDRPFFPAVDDYLHQAADKSNWPSSISYDPEDDGSELKSLGVHEHWNNASSKQYSKNLGTGNGIELVKIGNMANAVSEISQFDTALKAYPNPCNQQTQISYQLETDAKVSISLIAIDGKVTTIAQDLLQTAGKQTQQIELSGIEKGIYNCRVQISSKNSIQQKTIKLIVQ